MDGRKFTILVQNVFVILEVTDDFMRSWCSSSKLIKFSTYYTLQKTMSLHIVNLTCLEQPMCTL